MSGFNGINQFGSLTVNGKKLTFEDFDKDKNGEITTEEYNSLLQEVKLDSVEFSSVDKDGDKVISEDELTIFDQKYQMQEAINNMSKTISSDFSGKSEYLAEVTTALKELIEDFAANYTGEVENMAKDFEAQLPEKYQEIKNNVLANDPDTVKSNVLDEIYAGLITPEQTRGENGEVIPGEALPESAAKRLAKELEAEADKYIKDYKGTNLAEDLKAHLEEFMNKSDAEKLQDAAAAFGENVETLGAMIDNGADLTALKEFAKEFLLAALDAGVTIKLGGTTIKTENAITTALKKFSDGDELKAAMDEVIAGLNTTTLKETIVAEEEQKAQEAADKAFTDTKGSEYQINPAVIDYSGIPGYFDGTKYTTKGKSGHDENIRNQARQMIEQSTLKEQMKQQITDMLAAKGISFDKVATLFENVFNDSLTQTLNSITSHKTNSAWLNKNKKYQADQDVQTIINNFINNFNTNITAAIDGMNASDKDFDLQDIDYDAINQDENGNEDPIQTSAHGLINENISGKIEQEADKACQRMQSQLLRKAKAMCEANGIEFDLATFNTIFNNASSTAKAASISTRNIFVFSSSTLDTTKLAQTLVTTFQTNYTTWVNTEKSKVD